MRARARPFPGQRLRRKIRSDHRPAPPRLAPLPDREIPASPGDSAIGGKGGKREDAPQPRSRGFRRGGISVITKIRRNEGPGAKVGRAIRLYRCKVGTFLSSALAPALVLSFLLSSFSPRCPPPPLPSPLAGKLQMARGCKVSSFACAYLPANFNTSTSTRLASPPPSLRHDVMTMRKHHLKLS